MAHYTGKGWHFQHTRHSNARKYGRAGGTYKKSIILGTMSSPTKPQIFMSGKDRIEMTYDAIDEMNRVHGTPRPISFGGRKWDKNEELAIYVKQVGERYTPLQWKIMLLYAKQKGFNTSKAQKELGKIYGKHYGKCENITIQRPKAPLKEESTELPIQFSINVPSTKNIDEPISPEEFQARIDETKKFLSTNFGGDTEIKGKGDYTKDGRLIQDDVSVIESSMKPEAYKSNKKKLEEYIAKKHKEWTQDTMGFSFEDAFYIYPKID